MLSERKYSVLKTILYDLLTDKKGFQGTEMDSLKETMTGHITDEKDRKLLFACVDAKVPEWFLNGVLDYSKYEEYVDKVAKKAGTLKIFARQAIAWWADTLEEDIPRKPRKKNTKRPPLRGKVPPRPRQLQGDVAKPIDEEMGIVPADDFHMMGEPPEPPKPEDIEVMGKMIAPENDDKSQEGDPWNAAQPANHKAEEPEAGHPLMGDVAAVDVPEEVDRPAPVIPEELGTPIPAGPQPMGSVPNPYAGQPAPTFNPMMNGAPSDIAMPPKPEPPKPLAGAVVPVKPRPDGKKICNELRDLRKKVADENGIPYETEPCTYDGPCAGTCPKCDEEAAYIEKALSEKENNKD